MENSAKALYIAGSLLIALVVISLLVAAFNNIGGVQKTKDDIEYQESIVAFNREYEAYNNRIMLGVDVISCINKAINNNEQFAKNGKWARTKNLDNESAVQIEVLLKDQLKESMQIYTISDTGKELKYFEGEEFWSMKEVKNDDQFKESIDNFFDVDLKEILVSDEILKASNVKQLFGDETSLSQEIEMEEYSGKDYYVMQLLDDAALKKTKVKFEKGNTGLLSLAKYFDNREIVRVNKNSGPKVWSSVKWTTVLSDFKKRKFECAEVFYNDNTGKIDSMVFIEK